jgi:hypothetical protein
MARSDLLGVSSICMLCEPKVGAKRKNVPGRGRKGKGKGKRGKGKGKGKGRGYAPRYHPYY